MRVAATVAATDGMRSGLGVYVQNVYRHLLEQQGVESVSAYGPSADLTAFEELAGSFPGRISLHSTPKWAEGREANVLWHLGVWTRLLQKERPRLVHWTVANRRVGIVPGLPSVGTIHDLAELELPERYSVARRIYLQRVAIPLFRGLTRAIAVSAHTATQARKVTPARIPIDVVPNGVDLERFCVGQVAEAQKLASEFLATRSPFVFYPARLEHPVKNHVTLIRAFARAKEQENLPHLLVCAGADWNGAEEVRRAAQRAGEAVRLVGFLPTELLPAFYRAASAVAFPSRFEGFGLPLLEAMACGTPVVSSNAAALPEVAGNAALLVDPLDEDGWVDSLIAALTNDALRARLQCAGLTRAQEFGWERCAQGTMRSFSSALVGAQAGGG